MRAATVQTVPIQVHVTYNFFLRALKRYGAGTTGASRDHRDKAVPMQPRWPSGAFMGA